MKGKVFWGKGMLHVRKTTRKSAYCLQSRFDALEGHARREGINHKRPGSTYLTGARYISLLLYGLCFVPRVDQFDHTISSLDTF